MAGRPEWQVLWGEGGLRYEVLTIRARAILAAAVAEKPFTLHPWMEHEWKPIADAANRIFSLFVQAKFIAGRQEAASALPAFRLEGEYKGLADGKQRPLSFSLIIPNDKWRDPNAKVFDIRAKPKKVFEMPIVDWREGIEAGPDARLVLRVFAAGENHPPEVFDFLEQQLKVQLSLPILPPNVFERGDMRRTLGLTASERLWDLRVRFTDFIRRFLACYRSDLRSDGWLTPDPLTVFFVRARVHHGSESSFHARSGLFGHRYFLDDGQKRFLNEQRQLDPELPTEAIYSEYLPFPDGLCSSVYLAARSSDPTHVGLIFEGYEAIANQGELKRLEATFLNNRTLMEVPIYDDLSMLGDVVPDGPSLILCIAIPNSVSEDEPRAVTEGTPAPGYAKFLEPPKRSSYRLAEEQVVREMAHRMTRRFLSPLVSSEATELIGISPAMSKVKYEVERVAPTNMHIILLGQTGTGKTQLAKLIHRLSGRSQHPIVTLDKNCDGLFADALLGHVKGAFTGADKDRTGSLKLADKGTLFIDDIDRWTWEDQSQLLRVIEEQTFKPLGTDKEFPIDVRFIVASNEPLRQWVKERKFREDLFGRLDGMTIELPPLRDRRQDIPIWADRFLQKMSIQSGRSLALTPAAMERLMNHEWRKNLRELDKVIERAVAFCVGTDIGPDDLRLEDSSQLSTVEQGSSGEVGDPITVLRSLPGEYIEDKLQAAYYMLYGSGVPRRKP